MRLSLRHLHQSSVEGQARDAKEPMEVGIGEVADSQ